MTEPDATLLRMERPSLADVPAAPVPAGYRIRADRTGNAEVWTNIQREADA